MSHMVCPWWLGYFLASPIRRLLQDPSAIVAPWVSEGMTVLEPGPGMGFFTLEMARLVGPNGRVVAVDVQRKMLESLVRRARRVGLEGRIETREAHGSDLRVEDLEAKVDFVLAFAVVHELPDVAAFFAQAHRAMKSGARMLVAEPNHHVKDAAMEQTLDIAGGVGFRVEAKPSIKGSRAALLVV